MISPPVCGLPLDASLFDDAQVFFINTDGEAIPRGAQSASLAPGEQLELARFELPAEHCGELLYFTQFTDRQANNPRNILTMGYHWAILVNDRPLAPWLTFDHIRNPWGMSAFPLSLRLPEKSVLRMVIRNVDVQQRDPRRWLRQVGGRLVGAFWFAEHHGGPSPLNTRQPWRSSEGSWK